MRATFTFLLLIGCATAQGVNSELDRPVTLRPGATAQFPQGLQVQFWEVTEESRCPVDVQCVQAGRAVVSLRISAGGQSSSVELDTADRRAAEALGYRITLEDVSPEPVSGRNIDQGDYRVRITVSRA